jgi:hypothetical protein
MDAAVPCCRYSSRCEPGRTRCRPTLPPRPGALAAGCHFRPASGPASCRPGCRWEPSPSICRPAGLVQAESPAHRARQPTTVCLQHHAGQGELPGPMHWIRRSVAGRWPSRPIRNRPSAPRTGTWTILRRAISYYLYRQQEPGSAGLRTSVVDHATARRLRTCRAPCRFPRRKRAAGKTRRLRAPGGRPGGRVTVLVPCTIFRRRRRRAVGARPGGTAQPRRPQPQGHAAAALHALVRRCGCPHDAGPTRFGQELARLPFAVGHARRR